MKDFSIYVNSAEKIVQARRKKKINQRYRILLCFAIIIIAVVTCIVYQYREFQSFSREKTVVEETSTATQIEPYKGGVIKYGDNIIAYYDSSGSKVWSKTYSVSNPQIKISENYIMVADLKGTQVYIYNEKGKEYTITTSYAISDAEIANQGVVAVALSTKKTNYIELYNISGEKLVSIQTSIDETGYPLDIALSPNGGLLCASYFIVNGVEMKNRLTFYDFSEDGAKTENILGGVDFDNTIVPTVAFLGDDTVCAFGDDKISVYNINSKPKLKKEISVEASIQSIAYDSEHFAIIRERSTDETEGNYTLQVFSKNGNKIGHCGISDDYNTMMLYKNKILLNSAYHSTIITTSGRKIFDYNFSKHLLQIVPGKGGRDFFVEYEDRLDLIKLK
jgi:hypothetical protein